MGTAGAELAYQIYNHGWMVLDMQNKANPSAAVVRTGAGTRYDVWCLKMYEMFNICTEMRL